MKTRIVLLALVWFTAGIIWGEIADAGIFRRGPMIPWRHQQWKDPKTPTPNVTPLPPPILDPVLTGPSSEEIEEDKRLKELEKKAEKMEKAEVSSADPNNKLPFSLPIWLPVAAGGLGLAGAKVVGVRRKIGSIVSD